MKKKETLNTGAQIPVAFFLVMVPHSYAISLAGKNYDISK